jgi:hypothetical protein
VVTVMNRETFELSLCLPPTSRDGMTSSLSSTHIARVSDFIFSFVDISFTHVASHVLISYPSLANLTMSSFPAKKLVGSAPRGRPLPPHAREYSALSILWRNHSLHCIRKKVRVCKLTVSCRDHLEVRVRNLAFECLFRVVRRH